MSSSGPRWASSPTDWPLAGSTPVLIATVVLLASYLSELGQAVFTAGRTVQASDAVANAVGVGVGILFAQVLDWATRRRAQAER